MVNVKKVDHVGIRVSDKHKAMEFYGKLGFETTSDTGFEKGHPIIMRHPSGVVINLLGPATYTETNMLMGDETKYAGYTHVSLEIESVDEARKSFKEMGIPITGSISFGKMREIFIRDPDKNVIEFDSYTSDGSDVKEDMKGYSSHPN